MKNKLGDLNNHLFAQIERLGEEDLTDEQLEKETKRAKAITSVASQIISNGNLVLQGQKFMTESYDADKKLPKMLEG